MTHVILRRIIIFNIYNIFSVIDDIMFSYVINDTIVNGGISYGNDGQLNANYA